MKSCVPNFTTSLEGKSSTMNDLVDSAILDLSFKKDELSSSRQISHNSKLPAVTDKQLQVSNQSDSERKSPFEGRNLMITPPSESDSPKKIKYEMFYNYTNVTNNSIISQHEGFSTLPINMSIPLVSSVTTPRIPAVMENNECGNSQANQPQTSSPTSFTPEGGLSTLSQDNSGKKAPRPFKAYPKDPLSLTTGAAELLYDQNSNEDYSEFRKRMLESVRRSNEGINIKMRRVSKSPGLPTSTMDEKDAAYWERRKKNNEAAKRSRDARRAKEDEIAIRAAFLEQENAKLKYEVITLRNETAKLRCMIFTS